MGGSTEMSDLTTCDTIDLFIHQRHTFTSIQGISELEILIDSRLDRMTMAVNVLYVENISHGQNTESIYNDTEGIPRHANPVNNLITSWHVFG